MKALAHCQAYGPDLDKYRAKILGHAGTMAMLQGNFTAAFGFLHESEALCRALNDTAGLARVFRDLGMCAMYSTQDLAGSRLLFEKSLAFCRQINDTHLLIQTLLRYGDAAYAQGDDEQVESIAKECIALAPKINDLHAVAYGTRLLGQIASDRNDYETARVLYEKSLVLFQNIANKSESGFAIAYLGFMFHAQEQYEQAATCYADALKIVQKINTEWITGPLEGLGYTALHQQHWQEASTYFLKSLAVCRERERFRGIASPLAGLAGVAEGQGRLGRAAQLLGVAETSQKPLVKVFKREYERIYAFVHSALGEEAFEAAAAKGREMSLDEAIAFALEGAHEKF
jgi:tetratricopeptide (TPR) repeat protein